MTYSFGRVARTGGEATEGAHRIAHHLFHTPSRVGIAESRHILSEPA